MYRDRPISTDRDKVGGISKDPADVGETAETAPAAQDEIWRIRIADHGRWMRDNPAIAAELHETMLLWWNRHESSQARRSAGRLVFGRLKLFAHRLSPNTNGLTA